MKNNEEGKELIQGKESNLTDIFVEMHEIVGEEVKNYEKEMKKHYYVTPLNYSMLLQNFNKLLAKKQEELIVERNRYELGVKKLYECKDTVNDTKEKLIQLEPVLKETSKETEKAIRDVEKETKEAEKTRALVLVEQTKAKEKQEVASAIKSECDEKLSLAKPALEDAQAEVAKLKKENFVEIKAYKEPPKKAIIIFEGTLRLLGIFPKKKGDQTEFFKAQIKKQLTNIDFFLKKLKTYKVEDISRAVIDSLKEFIQSEPLFDPSVAQDVSDACYSLCKWVFALRDYYDVYQTIIPLQQNLKLAEDSLAEANAILKEKVESLQEVEARVDKLKDDLETVLAKKKYLTKEIKDCEIKCKRANELIEGLSGENDRWMQQVTQLNDEIDNILGDIILACGYVSYL